MRRKEVVLFQKFLEESKRVRLQKQDQVRVAHSIARNCVNRTVHVLGYSAMPIDYNMGSYTAAAFTEYYETDMRHWRELFRQFVYTLSEVVPAWQHNDKEFQYTEMFKRIYDSMDLIIYSLTNTRKTFYRCFKEEFEPAMQGRRPPYDVWRKINLCCCSPFWRGVTVEAIRPLIGQAARDYSKVLGIESNVKIRANGIDIVLPEPGLEIHECLRDAEVLYQHCIEYLEAIEQ